MPPLHSAFFWRDQFLIPRNSELQDFYQGDFAMRSYSTARSIFSFLEVIGWIMVAIGIFAAIALAGTTSRHAPAGAGLIAMLPGLGLTIGGFLSVGLVQSWRAAVDTAELTQQMLKVARDQLEVSQQALQKSNSVAQSFTAVATAPEKPGSGGLDLPVFLESV